jgi:hypothetical protein
MHRICTVTTKAGKHRFPVTEETTVQDAVKQFLKETSMKYNTASTDGENDGSEVTSVHFSYEPALFCAETITMTLCFLETCMPESLCQEDREELFEAMAECLELGRKDDISKALQSLKSAVDNFQEARTQMYEATDATVSVIRGHKLKV